MASLNQIVAPLYGGGSDSGRKDVLGGFREFRKFVLEDLDRFKDRGRDQFFTEAGRQVLNLRGDIEKGTSQLRQELLGVANRGSSGSIIAAAQAARRGRGGSSGSTSLTAARAASEASGTRTAGIARGFASASQARLSALPQAASLMSQFAQYSGGREDQAFQALLDLARGGMAGISGVATAATKPSPGILGGLQSTGDTLAKLIAAGK